jgi:hypothetical protein
MRRHRTGLAALAFVAAIAAAVALPADRKASAEQGDILITSPDPGSSLGSKLDMALDAAGRLRLRVLWWRKLHHYPGYGWRR